MSTRTRAALPWVLAALLLVGPAAGGTVAPAADPARTADVSLSPDADTRAGLQPLAPDNETLRVTLRTGGNARWTIRSNYSLDTEAEARAFRDLGEQYTNGELRTRRVGAFRTATDRASEATGRSMAIRNVRRSYNVTNGTGQLILQFTWTNFSRQTNDRLYADDVFNTSGATWLPGLEPYQQLVIEPPPDHTIVRATPAGYTVSGGTVRWQGPRQFEPGDLSASYRTVESPQQNFPVGLAALLVGGIGVAVLVGFLLTRVGLPALVSGSDEADDDEEEDEDEDDEAASADGPDADEDVDAELLSDEERIERLLERNGGRMKQATIVKETEWSNAKVSQLLSAMDDEDRIDKLRIGRENLISFPDEDVTDLNEE